MCGCGRRFSRISPRSFADFVCREIYQYYQKNRVPMTGLSCIIDTSDYVHEYLWLYQCVCSSFEGKHASNRPTRTLNISSTHCYTHVLCMYYHNSWYLWSALRLCEGSEFAKGYRNLKMLGE